MKYYYRLLLKLFPNIYKIIYYLNFFRSHLQPYNLPEKSIFIVAKSNQGWILDAICKEIIAYDTYPSEIHYGLDRMPKGRYYFFSHYSLFVQALKKYPFLFHTQNTLFYTHTDFHGFTHEEMLFGLSFADNIICMNSVSRRYLIDNGIQSTKIHVVIGGVDTAIFKPHQRVADGSIIFSTAYYPRKAPDTILKIVSKMPYRSFILLGKNWQNYSRYDDLLQLSNLHYIEAPYADYPSIYAKASVYVSVSTIEGGPIPLLETMACNIVPVVSNTGFSQDVIVNETNGFIFEIGASDETICQMINKAFMIQNDIYLSSLPFTWEKFACNVLKILRSKEHQ